MISTESCHIRDGWGDSSSDDRVGACHDWKVEGFHSTGEDCVLGQDTSLTLPV